MPDSGSAADGVGVSIENSLDAFMQVTQRGDYVAAGVGMRNASSGLIEIAGVPSTAAVSHAILYWAVMTAGAADADFNRVEINGNRVRGAHIASGPDTCWETFGVDTTHVFRADVTAFVRGDGPYRLSNMPATGGLMQGASLVVVYQDSTAALRNIVLYDGADVIDAGTFSVATVMTVRPIRAQSAKTTFVVADGQDVFSDTTLFNGVALAVDTGAVGDTVGFEGSDGPLWDTDTYDVSHLVGVGDGSVTVGVSRGTDCLTHVAQVFSGS